MIKIETTFEFPFGIPCRKDLLGKELEIIINSYKGIIAFPEIPIDYIERIKNEGLTNSNLKPPKQADLRLLYKSEEVNWGYFSDTFGNSIIERCSIWFYSTENEIDKIGNELSENTKNYINKMLLFTEILSKSIIDEDSGDRIKFDHSIDYWTWEKNKGMTSVNEHIAKFSICIGKEHKYISLNIIKEAIKYANNGYEPNLVYKLLRDSIFHKKKKDYRRSILDSATAIEITLTKRIEMELLNRKINDINLINSILKKYHSLNGRIELINALNIKLPKQKNEYTDFLAKTRNKAIHAGYPSNQIEANKVIEIAIDTLKEFSSIYE